MMPAKRILAATLATIIALPGAASAEAEACLSLSDNDARLACYDNLHGFQAVAPDLPPPDSAWSVRVDTSDFTDETSVFLTTQSTELVQCRSFGRSSRLTLYIRCVENTTSLYFTGDCHLASGFGGYGTVDVRIDDENVWEWKMEESTDNKALGLWWGGVSIGRIKRMLDSDRLLIRFTPYNMSPTTAEFPTTGLREAIAPLRAACGW